MGRPMTFYEVINCEPGFVRWANLSGRLIGLGLRVPEIYVMFLTRFPALLCIHSICFGAFSR